MFYAAVLGVALSSIFLVYTGASITRTFFISAAIVRRTEPVRLHHAARSLAGFGSFLFMGLFGMSSRCGQHVPAVERAPAWRSRSLAC